MRERPQDTAKERLKFLSEQMQQKDYLESLQVNRFDLFSLDSVIDTYLLPIVLPLAFGK
jgi:hypothetical protein